MSNFSRVFKGIRKIATDALRSSSAVNVCVFPRLWLRYLTPNVLVPSPRPQRYAMLASATPCPNQRRRLLWRSLIHLEKRRVLLKMTSTLKFWPLRWTSGATITASTTVSAMTRRQAMNGGTQAGQSALRHALEAPRYIDIHLRRGSVPFG